jgi:hypothetical protein
MFHNPNESLILPNFGKLTQNPEEITLKLTHQYLTNTDSTANLRHTQFSNQTETRELKAWQLLIRSPWFRFHMTFNLILDCTALGKKKSKPLWINCFVYKRLAL